MKRQPSPARLAKGLWSLAAKSEVRAAKLSALGFDSHARAVEGAAQALSSAALAVEDRLARVQGGQGS